MTKKKILLIVGLLVLAAAVAVLLGLLLPSCGNGQETPEPDQGDMTYTVQVKNANDQPLADVGVYIYEDASLTELVWYDTTNENGEMFFKSAVSANYVAVLANVPAGYAVEDSYPIFGYLTEIILYAGQLDAESMETTTLGLGDVMMDFTIVDTDGVEHTLSELLKTKKAVVLNFWYIECQPCNMEFPYLQEAYEQYRDDIEILALNPVNTDEAAIAAFKERLGLSFPVAMVEEAWAQLMKLTAYPTTVVIDRYGNISLMHTGMFSDTDTVEQIFDYFIDEEYESNVVDSIDEIVAKAEGTAENPAMQGGGTNFKATVGAGKTYYFDLIKMTTKTYMTVKGEGEFTVTYNGKEYKSADGSVTVTINPEGPLSVVPIAITNNSNEEQTYDVTLSHPKGSYSNPYKMKLGEFTAKTRAGDEQGTYYTYTAEATGTLTVKCLSASVKKYGFFLYNLDSYAMRNTDEDGRVDEEGYIYTSVQVKKGQKIQFNVAVARDDDNNIAAGTFQFEATLVEGEVENDQKVVLPETTYAVTVTDEDGKAMSGVTVYFKGSLSYTPPAEEEETPAEGEDTTEEGTTEEDTTEEPTVYTEEVDDYVTTGDDGVASVTALPGTLTATVRVPEGYKLATTQYTLTEEAPTVTVKLAKIVYADYTVTVTYPDGDPAEGVIVMVGSGVGFTDENGQASFRLEEAAYTTKLLKAPEGFEITQDGYSFGENNQVTVALGYAEGTDASNPIKVEGQISITTDALAAGQTEYYEVSGVGGTTLKLNNANATVTVNGVQYSPDENGLISVELGDTEPVALAVTNNGEAQEAFTVNFTGFPEGSIQNPTSLRNVTRFSINVPEGAEEGYYCTWTPTSGDGTMTLTLRATSATNCDVIVSWGDQAAKLSDSEGGNTLTMRVQKNTPILIQGIAQQAEDGTYPAVKIDVSGKVVYDTGITYTVNVVNGDNEPQSGVQVQFMKDGAAVKTGTTDTNGAAAVVLEAGTYTLAFPDSSIICDTSGVELTETAPTATVTISYEEDPVPDGMTRYSVNVQDFAGNSLGDVLVMYTKDGADCGYSMIPAEGGKVSIDLATAAYDVTLYFLGDTVYYYEQTTAKLTETYPNLTVYATKERPQAGTEHYYFGTLSAVNVGGTYMTVQPDANSFYVFTPTEPGVYYISASDPDTVLTYWGQSAYVAGDLSNTLEDYTPQGFSVAINTNALGRNVVVGVTGTEDTILIITRTGDAEEDAVYEVYKPKTAPTQVSLQEGLTFTKVDLTASTDTYKLVLNEEDGYYHIGSADGPVMYIQLTFNKVNPDSPVAPSYIHLYAMVGGVDNTGTGFKCVYTDDEGNEHYEDYTEALRNFGACSDALYGVYPLTEDLMYIIQMGGGYKGWWDGDDQYNRLFEDENGDLDTSINLEIAWLFAGCYIDDGAVMSLTLEETPAAEETLPAEDTTTEEVSAEETLPIEEGSAEEEPAEEEPGEEESVEEASDQESQTETDETLPAEEETLTEASEEPEA